ncbi:hypothetical protein GGR50DRAFT_216156 [Xylaria sp. CBS 124048]|nr:hypothetical protein GGR50DRAFT_216156 [Xylaria sp. CBS 124048]
MEFLCVRTKPRHSKRKRLRQESAVVRIEARPNNPKKMEKTAGYPCRKSSIMPHSFRDVHTELVGLDNKHRYACACDHCHPERLHLPTSNPGRQSECSSHKLGLADHTRGISQQAVGIDQVYVHPYSAHHYRFPVVDHSEICRGSRSADYPACYMVLVPEAATVRDVEAVLAPRPGLVAMVRLLSTEEPVHIGTFHCIKTLHESSMQLEIWNDDKGDCQT